MQSYPTFPLTRTPPPKSCLRDAVCTYVIAAAHSHLALCVSHCLCQLRPFLKMWFSWLLLITALARCDLLFAHLFFGFVFRVSKSRCCCTSAGQLLEMSGCSCYTVFQHSGNSSFFTSLLFSCGFSLTFIFFRQKSCFLVIAVSLQC